MSETETYFEDTDIEALDPYIERPTYTETGPAQEAEPYPVSEAEQRTEVSIESTGTLELSTQLLTDRKGGTAEDWTTTSRSEGGVFDGKEICGPDGVSLTKEIEARGIAEEIAEHREMLQQWAEGGERVVFLPDHVETDGGERRQFVTMMILGEDGRSVSYEIRETMTRILPEDEYAAVDSASENSAALQYETQWVSAEETSIPLAAEYTAEASTAAYTEADTAQPAQQEQPQERRSEEVIPENPEISSLQSTIDTAQLEALLDIDSAEDRMFVGDTVPAEHAQAAELSAIAETFTEEVGNPPQNIVPPNALRENVLSIRVEPNQGKIISIPEKDMQQMESSVFSVASSEHEKAEYPYIHEKLPAALLREIAPQIAPQGIVVNQKQRTQFTEQTQVSAHKEASSDRGDARTEVSRTEHGVTPASHTESEHTRPAATTKTGAVVNNEQHFETGGRAQADSNMEQNRPRANAKEYNVRIEPAADMLSYALGIPPQHSVSAAPGVPLKERPATVLPFYPQAQEEESNRPSASSRSLRGITLSKAA